MPGPSLLATSDLHVMHPGNREVVQRIEPYAEGDWLIVAGDVADTVNATRWALKLLRSKFEKVIWVPGNHELWTPPHDSVKLRGQARYEHLVEVCRTLGVLTPEDEFPVWTGDGGPAVVAPLFTLYDYSWRTPGSTPEEAMQRAYETRVVATDEFMLHPDPHESRADWCAERIAISRARLDAIPADLPTVLVSHWPLHRGPTEMLRHQQFAMWCGTTETEDWHTRYRAAVAVYGHLHIPLTLRFDGVRFEEVSLGYPREWGKRPGPQPPYPVRRILPADPDRKPMNSLLVQVAARFRQMEDRLTARRRS